MSTAAFQAGKKAGLHGLSFSLNPFELGSAESDEWIRGWNEGESDRHYEADRMRKRDRDFLATGSRK